MRAAGERPLPVCAGDVVDGKYRVERMLGRGGMGYVLAARHAQIGHLVAIKLLLPEAAERGELVERFLREAKAAVLLKSQHATRVSDVGTLELAGAPRTPYLVMEYLEGQSLGELSRRGGLPIREAALYVSQACEAVDEAHRSGIVHRDLKPDNLFLTRDANGAPLVKVLDFGISRLPLTSVDDMRLTGTSDVMGTPLYMSPEQMASARNAGPPSDIWALGVTLFELLTGEVPFPGDTVTEICARVLAAHPPRPSELRRDVPPDLDAVVLRCLEKDTTSRFASARELARALSPFLVDAGATVATLPATTPLQGVGAIADVAPGGTPTAPARPSAAAGASTGASVAWNAATAATVAGTPAASPRRSRTPVIAGAAVFVLAAVALFGLFARSAPSPPVAGASNPAVTALTASAPEPSSPPVPATPTAVAQAVPEPVPAATTPVPALTVSGLGTTVTLPISAAIATAAAPATAARPGPAGPLPTAPRPPGSGRFVPSRL